MGKPTGPSGRGGSRGRKSTGGMARRVQLETRSSVDASYQNRQGPSKEELKAACKPLKCEEDCELDPDEE